MPRYAADRVLLAPIDDVWTFLAEPYNLADWWPGVSGVEPDRRGLAPGARWKVLGPDRAGYFRKPMAAGTLLVLDVGATCYEPLVCRLRPHGGCIPGPCEVAQHHRSVEAAIVFLAGVAIAGLVWVVPVLARRAGRMPKSPLRRSEPTGSQSE